MERASTVDRTIAQQEVRRFARLLKAELSWSLNPVMYLAIEKATKRYDEGEDA